MSDKLLIAIGSCGAAGAGVVMPLFTIVMGAPRVGGGQSRPGATRIWPAPPPPPPSARRTPYENR